MPAETSSTGEVAILLVDDRPENLTALAAVLEPLGCRLVTAGSGREALKLLLDGEFAVILLDVQMPDMDGFETASFIRDRRRTRAIPIIFLSAVSTSSEHVFRGYEAGAVDYIVKPFDPIAIRSKVRVFMELRQQGEEIRRQAELLRQQELEQAKREADRSRQRRTSFLASVSLALERRTDVRGRIDELVHSCVPALGELAVAQLFPDESRYGAFVAVACANEDDEQAIRGAAAEPDGAPAAPTTDPERGHIDPAASRTDLLRILPGPLGEGVWGRLAPRSLIRVPLTLDGHQLGRLILARCNVPEPYDDDDLELAAELARRAALALETSRLYELERQRSRTLQLGLLGASPLTHPAVTVASRYLPGSADLEVGGDWYELIERRDGRILAVVGDVVGRGIRAATAMGKLRSAIGALAMVIDDTALLLEQLDAFAARIPEAALATAVCAQIDPEDGTVSYSSAGHMPALVVGRDGDAHYVDVGRGFPLGVDVSARRERGHARLAAGSTLIMFTDGLVESRRRPIEKGLERLRLAAAARATHEPEVLCDELLNELVDRPVDDVALVCLRFSPHPAEFHAWEFPARPNLLAEERHRFAEWLIERGFATDACRDLVLAFAEACSNVVRHAYERREGSVVVHLRQEGNVLTLRIGDAGRWAEPQNSDEGGRGLGIIRALVDDVHVHVTPHGTTLIMRKRLAPSGARSAPVRGVIPTPA
jgi:CheY-like chemotaxis protein/serine phosphatase RsbU (regulator of sigma subunit)/anti-sigma regulatory factor (Ser/Thr protein kinase)